MTGGKKATSSPSATGVADEHGAGAAGHVAAGEPPAAAAGLQDEGMLGDVRGTALPWMLVAVLGATVLVLAARLRGHTHQSRT